MAQPWRQLEEGITAMKPTLGGIHTLQQQIASIEAAIASLQTQQQAAAAQAAADQELNRLQTDLQRLAADMAAEHSTAAQQYNDLMVILSSVLGKLLIYQPRLGWWG